MIRRVSCGLSLSYWCRTVLRWSIIAFLRFLVGISRPKPAIEEGRSGSFFGNHVRSFTFLPWCPEAILTSFLYMLCSYRSMTEKCFQNGFLTQNLSPTSTDISMDRGPNPAQLYAEPQLLSPNPTWSGSLARADNGSRSNSRGNGEGVLRSRFEM